MGRWLWRERVFSSRVWLWRRPNKALTSRSFLATSTFALNEHLFTTRKVSRVPTNTMDNHLLPIRRQLLSRGGSQRLPQTVEQAAARPAGWRGREDEAQRAVATRGHAVPAESDSNTTAGGAAAPAWIFADGLRARGNRSESQSSPTRIDKREAFAASCQGGNVLR